MNYSRAEQKHTCEHVLEESTPTTVTADTTLNVRRYGDYYYIQLGNLGEGGKYYFEMFLERWAADATIAGLEAAWLNEDVKQNDLEHLFTHYKHLIRLNQVNRYYVRE